MPGGLFAKWTTDREAFEADFLDAHLSDDEVRHFIFHLVTLSEIARELDPTNSTPQRSLAMSMPLVNMPSPSMPTVSA